MGKKLLKGKVKILRSAYGKPLGDTVKITMKREELEWFGDLCVKYIVEEAKKASRYASSLPKDEKFYKSFGYKIVGNSTVSITSTWEWLPIYVNLEEQGWDKDPAFGKPRPFRMDWLTRQGGGNQMRKVPFVDKKTNKVIVRSAPLKTADAWIHPGVARHTFVNKGMKRARLEFLDLLLVKYVFGAVFDPALKGKP